MIAQQVALLIESQLQEWELASTNYQGLSRIQTKEICFDRFAVSVQFNPERIRSSSAKVDLKSIQERKCFLCSEHLPDVQKGISYKDRYTILINPYPIFARHLTIPSTTHVDQRIKGRIEDMLLLARDLPGYTVFYNGPECGASAPDHFHFQAGGKGLLPIENDLKDFDGKTLLHRSSSGNIYDMENYLRKTLVFESGSIDWLVDSFDSLLADLEKTQVAGREPMLNILALYDKGVWNLVVFPRTKHRPSQFYEEGDAQVLFSPASVDMGGMLIVPRETDFRKFDKRLIEDMFSQVSFTEAMWDELKIKLS